MIQTQTDNKTENRTNASIQGKETTREITLHNDMHRLPIARQNLEVFNKNTVNGHDVGSMGNTCSACGAFMFKDEKHVGKLNQSDIITFSA